MFFAVIPCLWRGKYFSSGKEPVENQPVTPILRHLMYKIKSTGPITVAEYMKEVLTNPAMVWVGEPDDRGASSRFARCEPGGGRLEEPEHLQPRQSGCLPGEEPPRGLGDG